MNEIIIQLQIGQGILKVLEHFNKNLNVFDLIKTLLIFVRRKMLIG